MRMMLADRDPHQEAGAPRPARRWGTARALGRAGGEGERARQTGRYPPPPPPPPPGRGRRKPLGRGAVDRAGDPPLGRTAGVSRHIRSASPWAGRRARRIP